jgi:quercetin dioxygenase-like cupin family protein
VQVGVDFEPDKLFGSHIHAGEEIICMLEGSPEYQIQGKPVTLKTGDVLFIPAVAIHAARNVGDGNAAEFATYVVEKGKPLLPTAE